MGKAFNEFYSNYTYMLNVEDNTEEVVLAAKSEAKWLTDKIYSAMSRGEIVGTSISKVLGDIAKRNPYALALFRKNPSRQNKSEAIQRRYLGDGGINLVKQDSHMYVVDGELLSGKDSLNADTKSMTLELT